jgi:hypothetical protein
MTCATGNICIAAVPLDAGTDAEARPAFTGSVRCAYFFGSAGVVGGCNGQSPIGNDYSITWTAPDGATMVCNALDWDVPADCPPGTPCTFTDPTLLPDSSILGTCQ